MQTAVALLEWPGKLANHSSEATELESKGGDAAGSLADFFFFLSSTLKKEAIRSSETSVQTTSTWRHIPGDCYLHSQCRENLKSYN
jgi:hypothetical protein